jgi:hypothetical protein
MAAKSRGVRQDWAGRRLGGTQSQVRCLVERRLDTFTVGLPNSFVCDRESDAQRVDEAVLLALLVHYCCHWCVGDGVLLLLPPRAACMKWVPPSSYDYSSQVAAKDDDDV